jgi:hypothetical protein
MSGASILSRDQYSNRLKLVGHIVALGFLGFLSGLATLASFHYGRGIGTDLSLKGSLFGTVLGLYLFAVRKIKSPLDASLLIPTSIVAYSLAVYTLFFWHDFFAGAIGGCLIFGAVLFLAAPPELTRLQKSGLLLLFTVGSGLLGRLGWSLESLGARVSTWLDQSGWSGHGFEGIGNIHDSVYAVCPVWQSGVAALIGVLLLVSAMKSSRSQIDATDRKLTVPAKLFFGLVLLIASVNLLSVLRIIPLH